MIKLAESGKKRKVEDIINELEVAERLENTRIIVSLF